MPRVLTDDEITRQLAGLPAWQRTAEGSAIRCDFTFVDFAAALDFVVGVGAEAEEMNHHPDVDIRWNRVTLVLWTHSAGGLTQLDIELAHRITALAP